MFVNGAFGNINHILQPTEYDAMMYGTASRRPFEEVERVGQAVASEALRLLPNIRATDVKIAAAGKAFPLRLRKPPVASLEEAKGNVLREKARLDQAKARGDHAEVSRAHIDLVYARHAVKMLKSGKTEAEMRLSAFHIGDLGVSCIPGEPFCEIGLAIKRNSPFPAAWVLGNTNGYTGYMPTRESFAQGGYEVRTCGWSKWQEDADGVVVKESLDLLNQLKSR